MNSNNDKKPASNQEIILNEAVETKEILNITVKVYLYGEESPTDSYHFHN